MAKVWEPGRKEELLKRLNGLRADSPAKWGKFTASKMLEHCAGGMLAGLGELPLKPKNSPLRFAPVAKLVIHVLPFPKSAPTAPELIPAKEPDFEQAKKSFAKALDKFIAQGPNGKFEPHAAFGNINASDWGTLTYRHIDHHWKQFGI